MLLGTSCLTLSSLDCRQDIFNSKVESLEDFSVSFLYADIDIFFLSGNSSLSPRADIEILTFFLN